MKTLGLPEGRRSLIILCEIVFFLSVLLACGSTSPVAKPIPASEGEVRLLGYILSRQSDPFGVRTNVLDTDQSNVTASGHEVLSESAGLLMRFYVKAQDQEAFRRTWESAKRVFDQTAGFSYRYSPKLGSKKLGSSWSLISRSALLWKVVDFIEGEWLR